MSDRYIKLIPSDPDYIPNKTLRNKAVKVLEGMLPESEECEAEVYDTVTFVDQGEYLDVIICPACRKKLKYHDENITEWWGSVEQEEEEHGAEGFKVKMPCCKKEVLFTDLTFHWPAGFAKFELSALNPMTNRGLKPEQLAELESVLKCKLIQILCSY